MSERWCLRLSFISFAVALLLVAILVLLNGCGDISVLSDVDKRENEARIFQVFQEGDRYLADKDGDGDLETISEVEIDAKEAEGWEVRIKRM